MFSFCVWLLILAGEFRSGKGEDVDSSPSFCTSGEWKWDLDVMNARCIEDVMKESDVEVLSALIADGIRRGLWDCTAKALQAIAAAGLSAWDIFSIEHRLLNKELSQLKRVADACKPVQTISPAFEWAESPGSIYLNIKFSHRLDAPATLDVTPDITIMPGQVIIEGHKGTRRFKLALDIYDDIDPENSNWSMVCEFIQFNSQHYIYIASNCTYSYLRGVLDGLQLHFLKLKGVFGQGFY